MGLQLQLMMMQLLLMRMELRKTFHVEQRRENKRQNEIYSCIKRNSSNANMMLSVAR